MLRQEAIVAWKLMARALPLLLVLTTFGDTTELLRDVHTDTTYTFSTEAKDVAAKISVKDAIWRADEWAVGFYGDALLDFVGCQFKTKPIRYWLVTFRKTETGQQYYAVILPDGRIVMPSVQRGL
jgi:hypothetical protein